MAKADAVKRATDLVTLAKFGVRTNRRWLVRDALHALRREGLMTPELSHLFPEDLVDHAEVYVAEALRRDELWVVAEAFDALRLESFGLPSLAIEEKTQLTMDEVSCPWVILLQRPGEEQTLCGLDVRGELLGLGWSGHLTAIRLPYVDLDVAEADHGIDGFALFLQILVLDANTQYLAGDTQDLAVPTPLGARDSWDGTRTLPLKPSQGLRLRKAVLRG